MDFPNYHTLAALRRLGYLLFSKNNVTTGKLRRFEGGALAAVPSIAHNTGPDNSKANKF
jgi:hypothetical protein